jgi:hypothetical protein
MKGEGYDRVGTEPYGEAVQSSEVLADGGVGLLAGAGLLGAAGRGGGSSGEVNLRYGIWDQMPAMDKMALLSALPVIGVFVILQRQFVEGVASTGIKG